jgi:hypothetical protein
MNAFFSKERVIQGGLVAEGNRLNERMRSERQQRKNLTRIFSSLFLSSTILLFLKENIFYFPSSRYQDTPLINYAVSNYPILCGIQIPHTKYACGRLSGND